MSSKLATSGLGCTALLEITGLCHQLVCSPLESSARLQLSRDRGSCHQLVCSPLGIGGSCHQLVCSPLHIASCRSGITCWMKITRSRQLVLRSCLSVILLHRVVLTLACCPTLLQRHHGQKMGRREKCPHSCQSSLSVYSEITS